jgi:DNA-binding NarL/FixJ family response regulator
VRLVVADPHPVVRAAIRLSCEGVTGIEIVDEVDSAASLLATCRALHPDVVVLDVAMSEGFDAVRGLNEGRLAGSIVVLTDLTNGTAVIDALRLGASAYLIKSSELPVVGERIVQVFSGERVISSEVEEIAVAELGRFARRAREGSELRSSLTARELEILVLIGRGLTMRQMATRLGISPRTVETHVAKLYRKLDVRTRIQAVSRAASLGLIELDGP